MLNHLGQFPMHIGPDRICSMVSEHDDTMNSITEQLTSDIFSVPNVQVFIFKIFVFYIVIVFILFIFSYLYR